MTFLEYAQRGKHAWWRYLLAVPIALLLTFVFGVLVTLPIALMGWLPRDVADQLSHVRQPLVFFPATALTFAVLLLGFVVAIRLLHAQRFGDVIGRWRWRMFAIGAAVWTGVLALATLVDFLIAPHGFTLAARAPAPLVVAVVAIALAVQTFTEEFVFRGYATQGLLLAIKRPVPTALVSGLIFGTMHIPNGWPQAANAVVFGTAFALIAIRTGGLAFTSGAHFVNNLFGAVVVVSASDVFNGSPGLVVQNTPHLDWSDAGLAAVGLIALAVAVFRLTDAPA
jgi:membrane protease YdiL (CAAX protease family)